MPKTITLVLAGGLSLLTLTTKAQNWRVGLLGAATYDRVSKNFRLKSAEPGSNAIFTRHRAAGGYALGLSISRALDERWSLDLQPRYQHLRSEFEIRTGSLVNYGHAEGGQLQLPVGLRYRLSPGSRALAPYLLGHLVLGWADLSPNADKTEHVYNDWPAGRYTSMGYSGPGGQLQLGAEAGAGVLIFDRLGLNLLAYYGLTNTRLVEVRSVSGAFIPNAAVPAGTSTATGTLRGHQLSVAAQGVLYLRR